MKFSKVILLGFFGLVNTVLVFSQNNEVIKKSNPSDTLLTGQSGPNSPDGLEYLEYFSDEDQ